VAAIFLQISSKCDSFYVTELTTNYLCASQYQNVLFHFFYSLRLSLNTDPTCRQRLWITTVSSYSSSWYYGTV